MIEINAKEARRKLGMLLNRVEEGEEVIILRRGKRVARLLPFQKEGRRLPTLKDFRGSIRIKGDSVSALVVRERKACY